MSCKQVTALLDTFVDGELPPDQTLAVEEHLSTCDACGERLAFDGALRTSMRSAVHAAAAPPLGFEDRLTGALRAERERLLEGTKLSARESRLGRRWVPTLLLAAMALGALAFLTLRPGQGTKEPVLAADVARGKPADTAETPEHALDELVRYHAAPPQPEITEPRLVERLSPEVGVPVRSPAGLKQYGASWEGGGVVPMNDQRAALFRYRVSNHPVTVYVYDARRVPLRAVLEPRVVHNQPVHVGERHGYSIAAVEQRGVGYAIATDLNDDESAELVTTMY